MPSKPIFDTLQYADSLTDGGVSNARVHAYALSDAMTQNLYFKGEIDTMFAESIKEFRENSRRMEREFRERTHELEKLIYQMSNRSISILGGLIVLVGSVATFAHVFFH